MSAVCVTALAVLRSIRLSQLSEGGAGDLGGTTLAVVWEGPAHSGLRNLRQESPLRLEWEYGQGWTVAN